MSENQWSRSGSSDPSADPSADRFSAPGESGGPDSRGPDAFDLRPGPPDSKGSGCSRNLLIGCGILLVLLGVATVLLVLNASKLATWMYTKLEEQVVAQLPEDLSEEDRQRLGAAFDNVRAAIRDGTVSPGKLQQAQGKMMEMAQDAEGVTAEEVRELTALLEEAAGGEPPAEEEPPADSGGGGPPS